MAVWSLFLSILLVLGGVPPAYPVEYNITEIWRGYGQLGLDDGHPQIDDSGQIVWVGYDVNYNATEIYFYSQGKTTEITNSIFGNGYPWINDLGQVVFKELDGYNSQIYLYDNGTITQITNNAFDHEGPQINDRGQLVWFSSSNGTDREIYSYDDGIITQITNTLSINIWPKINNNGQIVWEGYDGHDSEIYLYDHGFFTQITNNDYEDIRPSINDSGQVVWLGCNGSDYEIYEYSNGSTTQLTYNLNNASPPLINAQGEVVFFAFDGQNNEVYLYSQGSLSQITNNPYNNRVPQINDNGEIVWVGGDGQYDQIFVYSGGAITKLTDTAYSNYEPAINDSGQIVWYAYEGNEIVIYEATPKTNNISRYDFTYYYNGTGDYYTGYVFAPTSFKSFLTAGSYIFYQPSSFWADGYQSLGGGYYYITNVADGFDSSYDKKSYITGYYDTNLQALLRVNSDGSPTAGNIYVADRTAAWETGYALYGNTYLYFTPYTHFYFGTSSAGLSGYGSEDANRLIAVQSRAIWGAYWSETDSLLEEK